MTADSKLRYQTLTGAGQVDTLNQNVRDNFLAMFAASTTTRTNLTNMAQRFANRGENLLGSGVVITLVDVAEAIYNPDPCGRRCPVRTARFWAAARTTGRHAP